MNCPHCNELRNGEESARVWQCPNCKRLVAQSLPAPESLARKLSLSTKLIFFIVAFLVIVCVVALTDYEVVFVVLVSASPFILLYLLPTLIALSRNHPALWFIFIINLFLGWTVIGWGLTFIWALKSGLKAPP